MFLKRYLLVSLIFVWDKFNSHSFLGSISLKLHFNFNGEKSKDIVNLNPSLFKNEEITGLNCQKIRNV